MHNFHTIETEWADTWAYHLIPSGQSLRETLIGSCGENWLNAHSAIMLAKDITLQSAYIEIRLLFDKEPYYLQKIGGSPERPYWSLTFKNIQNRWITVKFHHQNIVSQIEGYYMENVKAREFQRQKMLQARRDLHRERKEHKNK